MVRSFVAFLATIAILGDAAFDRRTNNQQQGTMTTSPSPSKSPKAEVQRYLRTGDHDSSYRCWSGANLFESARIGDAALRAALVEKVLACDASAAMPPSLSAIDVNVLTRARVAPMVEGLFPKTEQDAVLAMLERSVVFLTPANIEAVLRSTPWLDTAWSLANLYVASIGAEKISQEARSILGLSEETTCYVSVDYFREQDPWADFLVHEAAHVFHNCKRATVGLAETRHREWLLDIDYGMRETFAYACEAYSRILTLGDRPVRRRASLAMHARGPQPGHPTVDAEEYLDILQEAVEARNGWKRILRRCAPRGTRRAPSSTSKARIDPAPTSKGLLT